MAKSRMQRAIRIVEYVSDFFKGKALDLSAYIKGADESILNDPIVFCMKNSTDPDIMYLDKAMKAPEAKQFRALRKKKAIEHEKRKK